MELMENSQIHVELTYTRYSLMFNDVSLRNICINIRNLANIFKGSGIL